MEREAMKKSFKATILFTILILFLSFFLPVILYAHDNEYVHPYIAEQAFLLWPRESGEIYQNLGNDRGKRPCSQATTGNKITEGTIEEDIYDPVSQLCCEGFPNCAIQLYYHHFYDPDNPPDGLGGWPGALAYAQIYWDQAKSLYVEESTRGTAYWYLGRIVHLLTDVAVPAHAHRDAHSPFLTPIPDYNPDSYEKHIGSNPYPFTFSNAKILEQSNPIPNNWLLSDLFNCLSQQSQYFPSDDYDGNSENIGNCADISTWPNTTDWRKWNPVLEQYYIEESNLKVIGDYLMPRTFQYISSLYKLFWREFHIDIEGPDTVESLSSNTFKALGKLNGNDPISYEWDFNYDGTFDPDHDYDGLPTVTPNPYYFKGYAFKTIALRVNGQDPPIVKTIYVKQYPIEMSLPSGEDYDSLKRRFQTPHSDLIEHYTWNFGDGSPNVVDDRDRTHEFPNGGFYTVTLTLNLKDGSTLTSYTYPYVGSGIRYIQGHTIYGDETWYSGGTYVVQGSITVAQGATLTIQHGVIVKLNGGVQIDVNGILNATGVTFTWADGQNPWHGIAFKGAGSSGSRLENCVIDHAQGYYYAGTFHDYWTYLLWISNSSPTITGCTIQNSVPIFGPFIQVEGGLPIIQGNTINGVSGYDGINISGGSTATVTGNTITGCQNGVNINGSSPVMTGNTLTGCQIGAAVESNSSGTYQGNTFSGNTYGIKMAYSTSSNPAIIANSYSNNSSGDFYVSGTISSALQWNEASALVYRTDGFAIGETGSLVIPTGRTIKFGPGSQLTVNGTLTATGVTFTWADGQNPWHGIAFKGAASSGSRLENCVIDHAQGYFYAGTFHDYWSYLLWISNSSPTITGCTIQNSVPVFGPFIQVEAGSPIIQGNTINGVSGYDGINISQGSTATLTENTITGCQTGLNISGDSTATLHSNILANNSSYALYYGGTLFLNATNNNWGDPSGPYDPSDDRATGGLYNPTGLGDRVSDHVNYYPWLNASVGLTAVPADLSGKASSNSIVLNWNANLEPYLGGYKIYYGTVSGTYTQSVIVGKVTSFTIPNLTNGTPYFIAISSMNTVGAESAKTAEISVTPKDTFTLTVTTSGSGTVSASGLTCNGNTCIGTYGYNTQLNITASGSNVQWSGCDSSNGSQCPVTMITDKAVTATFTASEYTLTVDKAGTGSGTVSGSGTYSSGDIAVVTAVADSGSTFTGWSGDCSGTASPLNVVMSSIKTCIAIFGDTKAPDLVVSTLSDGSWTNNGTLNISGTATDNMGVPALTINGNPITVNPEGTFSEAFALTVGPNAITTIASDLAGLQAIDARTINFDPTAPYIEIATPSDNSKTKQSTIEVSGTVDESSVVDIKINDYNPLPAQMNGNSFTLTVLLTYGINTIEVLSTDLAANNSSLKRTVTYDNQGPALSITDPSQDVKTNQSSMLIKGTVSDITAATVTVSQDQETFTPAVTNGLFEQLITFTAEKTYQIYVTATDELGNETTVQRNIIYDTTPPAVSLDPVTSPTNQNSQILTGTVEATAEVTVVCPTANVGQANYPTQTTWTVVLTNMAEGSNVITVRAADDAGNISGQTGATIIVDTIVPNSTITSAPSNPSSSTSASFSFSSTDSNSTFQCQMDNGGYQSCTSPKTYTNLSVGSHTFYVKATDAAGNTDPTPASYTWTITPAQMPNLSGNWKSLTTKSKGKQIAGTLQVINSGNAAAGSFSVTYYLSNDGITPLNILSSNTVAGLKAGKSTNLTFSYNTATSLTGKYIIAVIDSGNQIAETNENNNIAVSRIP